MIRHIPNIITSANLFSGCVGIVYAFQGDLKMAAWFVIVSGILDFFDGFSARLLKAYSNIGKDLDSLADVVSFGVLPGVIFFQLLSQSDQISFEYLPYLGFIITVFSAIRLAKFNNDDRQTTDFIGLNTPTNSFFVISLVYIADDYPLIIGSTFFLMGLIVLLSFLLISEIKLYALKMGDLSWKSNKFKYIFLIISLILLIGLGFTGVPFILALYIATSYLHFRSNIS